MAKHDIEEGSYRVGGARVALVCARFNARIVTPLREAALATLARHGVSGSRVRVVEVPGAFEIPLAAQRLARTGGWDAIIALGAVVRGDTPHFDYVAGACADGVARVALDEGLPVIFGVLTTDDEAQALARAGGAAGNKGHESALAALAMIELLRDGGAE